MKRIQFFFASLTVFAALLTSCNREDVGPLQEGQQTFALTGFDRLDMGSGFDVNVQPGATFSIVAKGDQRNLDDLDVVVRNGTLTAEYRTYRNRKFATTFTITMPTLRAVKFSGGVHATLKGFANAASLDLDLSGGTHTTFEGLASRTNVQLSGGSKLELKAPQVTTGDDTVTGRIDELLVDASGASNVQAFYYAASEVNVKTSGASHAEITATQSLVAEASGASKIRYRGNPAKVNQNASGASKIERD
ncbi:putative autotransporter adhesin-like protein [Larkinella arboricola]|uniref:Putative autotransporter adhesin-like protein n=1 Tax=Larkinella arboricola TaxID=643671 RepID=A0A327WPW6_LARAB|nr:head GIN domain-containing protein [Larkinella arboricola]RAJ92512.1 putative autotransporter adhesin-like protein [Larkinella arboricola]